MILDFLKDQCHLSSPLVLVVVLAIGALWSWLRPSSKGPRWYLAAVAFGYWFVSTSLGAALLAAPLSRGLHPVIMLEEARGTDAVVVLGGGAFTVRVGSEIAGAPTAASLLRAVEGARVFKLLGARLLIASGGTPRPERQARPESELIRDALVKMDIPAEAIIQESGSKTTRDQAVSVAAMLRDRHVERFVLVTSPTHMRRARAAFRRVGLDPIVSTSPLRSEPLQPPPPLLPNEESLWLSDDATYEYAAIVYYWLRGWL